MGKTLFYLHQDILYHVGSREVIPAVKEGYVEVSNCEQGASIYREEQILAYKKHFLCTGAKWLRVCCFHRRTQGIT